MVTITLKPLFHGNKEQIGIYFENYGSINSIVRKIPGIRWSKTHRCWHVFLNRENYAVIVEKIGDSAQINAQYLKEYLEKRKKIIKIKAAAAEKPVLAPVNLKTYILSAKNLEELQKLVETLQLSKKSESTIKTYKNEFTALLQILKNKSVDTLTSTELRRYMLFCSNKLQLSANTLNSRLNALKFYFEQVLHREKFFVDLPRAQRPQILPNILAENEWVGYSTQLKTKNIKRFYLPRIVQA